MFEENYESGEGFFYRCPGMSCPEFAGAAGPEATWEEKVIEACTNCRKCNGNAPLNPDDSEVVEDDFAALIEEVEDVISEQDAGFETEITDYTIYRLVVVYREAEKQVEQVRQARMQAFIKSWMTEK